MFRGLLYGSYFYPKITVVLGVIILLLMIITSSLVTFYLGSNELLGSNVITNLAQQCLLWAKNSVLAWSGFSVENPTNKIF